MIDVVFLTANSFELISVRLINLLWELCAGEGLLKIIIRNESTVVSQRSRLLGQRFFLLFHHGIV